MDELGLELGKIEAWISTIKKKYYMKILVSQDWICIRKLVFLPSYAHFCLPTGGNIYIWQTFQHSLEQIN